MNTRNIIVNLCILLVTFAIYSCDYDRSESISSKNDNTSKVVLPNPKVDEIISRIDSIHDEELYSVFNKDGHNNSSQGSKSKDNFQYGLQIGGFKPYEHYSKLSVMEVSKFSIGEWKEVRFVGFSKDSMYMLYQLGDEYYVKNLYSNISKFKHSAKKDFDHKSKNKQEAVGFMGSVIEAYNYDKKDDEFLKKNFLNLRVVEYPTEDKKGFYISIYDVKNTKYETLVYSKTLSEKTKPFGKVKNYDIYFTPDKSWAVVHPYFELCSYDYGFFLINIRKEYGIMLKNQAIKNYERRKYKEALTKYRQSIQMYPMVAEVFYDCAVLTKKLELPNYSKFAEKAVEMKPNKYSKRAYKEGLIKK